MLARWLVGQGLSKEAVDELNRAFAKDPDNAAALAVIAELFGEQRAEQVAAYTEYQWHKDADSDPFVEFLNQGALS